MNLTINASQQVINGDGNKKLMKIDFNYSSNKTIIPAIRHEDGINNAIIANLPFLTEFRTFNATMKSPTDLYLYTPDGNLIRKVPKNVMIGQGNVQGNNTNSYAEINFRSISGDIKNINVFLDDHYSKKFVSQEIILREIMRDFTLFRENTLAFFYGKNVRINLFINLDLQNHFNKYEFNCSHISTFLNDGVVCEQQIYFVELAPTSDYSFVKRLSELYIGTVKSFSSEGFVRELQIPNVIWFKDDARCAISYNNERGVLNTRYNSSESYEFSVYILVHNPLLANEIKIGSETIVGDLYTLINSASWAIFVVMVKPIMEKYNTVTVMRWIFLFGSFYILPIGLDDFTKTDWSRFNDYAIFATCFVVIATTFFAYLLNIYGLKSLSPSTVSAYIYLQPFLASIFAIIMEKDSLTLTKLFSGILIIFGLYLINKKSKKTTYD